MKRSIPPPTKEQQRRQDNIREIVGCIACRLHGIGYTIPEIHHLNSAGRNRGQAYTIGLCAWSHRGIPPDGMSRRDAELMLGPSLHYGSKPFAAFFGSDDELLAATNALLEAANC